MARRFALICVHSAKDMLADLVFLQSGRSVKRLRSLERRLVQVTKSAGIVVLVGALSFGVYHIRQRQPKELLARELELKQTKLEAKQKDLRVAGVSSFLERSTNLSASPPFTLLAPNLPGQLGTTTFGDTNAAAALASSTASA